MQLPQSIFNGQIDGAEHVSDIQNDYKWLLVYELRPNRYAVDLERCKNLILE